MSELMELIDGPEAAQQQRPSGEASEQPAGRDGSPAPLDRVSEPGPLRRPSAGLLEKERLLAAQGLGPPDLGERAGVDRATPSPVAGTQPRRSQAESIAHSLRNARKTYENTKIKEQAVPRAHALVNPRLTEEIIGEIIKKRQRNLSSLNERLADLFQTVTGKVLELQSSLHGRAEEDAWMRRLRKVLASDEHEILEPVMAFLAQKGNPVAELVRDFVLRQRDLLARFMRDSGRGAPAAGRDEDKPAVQLCIDECHLFTFRLMDLMQHNYAELQLQDHTTALKLTIQHFLFGTPLASQYMAALRRQHAEADALFGLRCTDLCWQDLFLKLQVREKFRFGRTHDAYAREGEGLFVDAVEQLRSLAARQTPFQKLAVLVTTCNLICQGVEALAQEQQPPAGDGPDAPSYSLGSEDLLLLLAYVVIRAQPTAIYSEFAFVSELIPEEVLRGEFGYVLATLQTCIHHIEQL